MATFKAQVAALTGITISASSTNPIETELDQFIADGVLDVTDKWLIGHPQDRELFMDETDLQVAQGANLDGADIISVVRADGVTAGNFRPCRKILQSQQSQVLDTESLAFASKYHPVYMLNSDNSVAVFPVPADNSGKDSYKIYYVNNTPKDGTGNALTFADSTLRSFPADKVYLVSLYAAIKSINNNMAAIIVDLTSFALKTVPPDLPVTAKSIPTYNEAVGGTTTNDEITQMLTYIETDEDVELATAKASEVALRFKRALDQFNSDMQAYQAENQGEIAHYSAEIQAYSAEVNAEVQEQQAKVQTETAKYQWLQDRGASLQAEYTAAFGTPPTQAQGEDR